MKLSVIMPAYNAAKVLEKSFSIVKKEVDKIIKDYEIIIAEDGSKDGTDKIAEKIAKKNRKVRHLHHEERLGRGMALKKAFNAAKGDFIVYIDADLDVSPKYIKNLVDGYKQGYDIVIGSKRHPLANTSSPFMRMILSKGYNFLARLILGSKLHDHQTGLKGIDKKVVREVMPYIEDNHWFWDTELLVLSQWMKKFRIKEVPIDVDYGFEGSTVKNFNDTLRLFKAILKMRMRKRNVMKRIAR